MASERANPLDYSRQFWLRAIMVGTIIFLYAPIISLIVFSFNDSRRTIVWRGFTTEWYVKAWNNPRLFEAFSNSLLIAVAAMILATAVGTALAIGLWRYRFPMRSAVEGAVALPIVVPEICLGVAMLVFFARIGWP
ncbi:MAG: spermidine/putrescine ABC transporter permease PotC, partial [Pseudomonadota bacterium]